MKEAIMKEIRREDSKMRDENDGEGGGKKKRVRINKEKVDINNASSYQKGDHQKGGITAGQQQGGKKIRIVSRNLLSNRKSVRKMLLNR